MATDKTNAIPTYEEVVSLIKKTIDEHETLAKIGYFNDGVLNETVLMNFRNTHINIIHCSNVTMRFPNSDDDYDDLAGCTGILILNAIGDQIVKENTCVFIGTSQFDDMYTLVAIGDVETGMFTTQNGNLLVYP